MSTADSWNSGHQPSRFEYSSIAGIEDNHSRNPSFDRSDFELTKYTYTEPNTLHNSNYSLTDREDVAKGEETRKRRRKCLPSRRPSRHWLWLLALVVAGVLVGLIVGAYKRLKTTLNDTLCLPNGEFDSSAALKSNPEVLSPLDIKFLFTISVAAGNLSFSAVKAIDVVWDVVVGRGLQVLLGMLAYHVFGKALLQTMETDSVSHTYFAALSYWPSQLPSMFTALAEFRRKKAKRGWKGVLRIIGISLCILYIASFPTLMSAMTGYNTNYIGYVRGYNGSLEKWSNFEGGRSYRISDGRRIGVQDNDLFNTTTNKTFANALNNCKPRPPNPLKQAF